jgi:pimeloyl-ACP methyl ester carboxylesterase
MTLAHDTAPRLVVTADGRAVGYRRLGEGPPVVLLHASPRSSAASLLLAGLLAGRFTVFALDSPGFGWSDPLRLAQPDAHDYGEALVAAFDALGLDRAPVYGSHTGAAIAVAAALDFPDRVTALALDGYAMFTLTEQAEYLATYLQPFRPEWDGTHLAWLWGRVKDQFTLFPWYLRGEVARIPRPLPPLTVMQAVVQDFLAAGDHYRPGYAAAFRFDAIDAIRRIAVPTVAMARSDDMLYGQLDKLTDIPDYVTITRLGTDQGEWAAAMANALAAGAGGQAPSIPAPHRMPGVMEVYRVGKGTIGAMRFGPAKGRPIILLPPIPGSARGEAGSARAIALQRPVWVLDLPGFGASSLSGQADIVSIAGALLAALRHAGVDGFDIAACGESGAIGAALAALATDARLVLLDPVPEAMRPLMAGQMTDLTPQSNGGHLHAAWHQLRDACFWRPWFQSTPAQTIPFGHDPDVPRLQAVLADWMRGGLEGRATLATAMATPLPADATAIVQPGHPWATGLANPTIEAAPGRQVRAAAILQALAPLS